MADGARNDTGGGIWQARFGEDCSVDKKILIKKYPNRRLYNTLTSGYITIKDVAELIKSGNRVEVRDADNGEDVTALVLTQIIMDKAKNNQGLLPVSLLHLVIQFGENLLHEFFEKYLEKTMESYLVYRKTMDDQVNAYLDMGMDFSSLAEKTIKDLEKINIFSETFKQYGGKK
jgi:polyhydroxyalkanoate synthesis repressor PhaR